MRVEKTLIQTLASQLSPTLIQLLFSFDQDMGVEKTVQTLPCLSHQLSTMEVNDRHYVLTKHYNSIQDLIILFFPNVQYKI